MREPEMDSGESPNFVDVTDIPSEVDSNVHVGDRVFRLDSHVLPGGGIIDVSFGRRSVPVDGRPHERFGVTSIRIFAKHLGPIHETLEPLISEEVLEALRTLPLARLIARAQPQIETAVERRALLEAGGPAADGIREEVRARWEKLDEAE